MLPCLLPGYLGNIHVTMAITWILDDHALYYVCMAGHSVNMFVLRVTRHCYILSMLSYMYH